MQYQESRKLCWIAVATSINHFYHPESTWTQCAVTTDVGRRLNGCSNETSACPPADVVANNPSLQAALADPYSQAAEYILDDHLVGANRDYLKTGNPKDPLVTTGNFISQTGSDLALDQIAAEVNAGRPVVAHLEWNADHLLLILDPVNGESAIRFQDFPSTYYGGAQHHGYTLTKRSEQVASQWQGIFSGFPRKHFDGIDGHVASLHSSADVVEPCDPLAFCRAIGQRALAEIQLVKDFIPEEPEADAILGLRDFVPAIQQERVNVPHVRADTWTSQPWHWARHSNQASFFWRPAAKA